MALRELIFPPRCLCCGSLGKEICEDCKVELQFHYYRTHVASLPVFSSIQYGAKASRILLAAKEDGVRTADNLMKAALKHSLRVAMKHFDTHPILVPIPHSKKALRKRGRNFVAEISDKLAREENLPIRQILEHNRRVRDQSQLDAPSRKGNISGSMSVVSSSGRPREVILIDDLMTTGATLGEAVRALENARFHVLGAVTAFVALPLR